MLTCIKIELDDAQRRVFAQRIGGSGLATRNQIKEAVPELIGAYCEPDGVVDPPDPPDPPGDGAAVALHGALRAVRAKVAVREVPYEQKVQLDAVLVDAIRDLQGEVLS